MGHEGNRTVTLAQIQEHLDANKVTRIKLGVFDADGVLRGKYISMDKFRSAAEGGLGFCDVIFGWDLHDVLYENVDVTVTGWHTGYPDCHARIDLSTFRLIPWEPGTAFFLMDLYDAQGAPYAIAPRQVLQRVVQYAEAKAIRPFFAAEYEFWMFQETPNTVREKGYRNLKTLTPGMFGYSVLRASQNAPLVLDIIDLLGAFNIALEGFHTETGPGVYEAAIFVDHAVQAADKAALFKTAVKEIAARHNVLPTFMAKWNSELPGSSGHLHQSLWSHWPSENLFHDEKTGMSATMRHYIAGLLHNMQEFQVLYCPTVNSYKRTVPGTWAPVNATWGVDSRTCAIRAIPGSAKSTRVETRLTGADINPYLAMAASLAAGLDGIERRLELPAPAANAYAAKDAPPLARNLREATERFRASATARRWFGDAFVDHYAATREWEMRLAEKAVTDWELARYLEIL
ncbi:MAG: glutamine synthetase [Bryobacterales bacterium]|nr:glutamine synthetase [Bryobacterales bacterium]